MKADLLVLVFSMIINSVIGLYYYLRVITTMFSAATEIKLPALSVTGNIILTIIAISILILGVYPGWLINIIMKFVAL
jgi:NADH-quinone oxidoreductase subunit N